MHFDLILNEITARIPLTNDDITFPFYSEEDFYDKAEEECPAPLLYEQTYDSPAEYDEDETNAYAATLAQEANLDAFYGFFGYTDTEKLHDLGSLSDTFAFSLTNLLSGFIPSPLNPYVHELHFDEISFFQFEDDTLTYFLPSNPNEPLIIFLKTSSSERFYELYFYDS